MKIENVKVDRRKKLDSEKANVGIHIKVTKDISQWLKDNEISPTALLFEAISDLGYKKKE